MKKPELNDEQIKLEVKNQYAGLVTSEGESTCCGPSCCTPTESMKGNLVKAAGYSDEELMQLPAESVENSFGCGNPLAFAEVGEGQTVLDIGSGVGIDCFIAADKVGKSGRVFGIDMTPQMIDKATAAAKAGGYDQVSFRLGEAEDMPVDSGSVDWVISNCVINLSPNKPKVFEEIARVLKPGGRFSISDIVLGDDLPDAIATNVYAWTGCIAGAIRENDYLDGLRQAGLRNVEVESRIVYDEPMISGFLNSEKIPLSQTEMMMVKGQVVGRIWSAKIKGEKQ